jgi:hypothetical protein
MPHCVLLCEFETQTKSYKLFSFTSYKKVSVFSPSLHNTTAAVFLTDWQDNVISFTYRLSFGNVRTKQARLVTSANTLIASIIRIRHVLLIQGDSFGTRPMKMRISQRLFISVAFSSAWTVVANIPSISSSIDMLLMKHGMQSYMHVQNLMNSTDSATTTAGHILSVYTRCCDYSWLSSWWWTRDVS